MVIVPAAPIPRDLTDTTNGATVRHRVSGVAPFAPDTLTRFTHKKPKPVKQKTTTLHGTFLVAANPCLTKPCLPGMAAAVKTGNNTLFLLKNGKLCSDDFSWEGFTPNQTDSIDVQGFINTATDINGNPYQTIEVLTLRKTP
ncbi:MAG TPA: hypothetical protein DER09_04720 [Prolixibacteraceae bacterium]|nr:hypothetical protein [Prolixibacteraceae bacterium]